MEISVKMFRLPKKVVFAVEAVVDIAYHAGSQPVQSRDITRRQGIPRRYLEQALQELVKANLLHGVRGPKGGYNLARERRRISLGNIIEIISKMDQSVNMFEEDVGSNLTKLVISPLLSEYQNEMMKKLDQISIDDLCQKARSCGVISEGRKNLDFSI